MKYCDQLERVVVEPEQQAMIPNLSGSSMSLLRTHYAEREVEAALADLSRYAGYLASHQGEGGAMPQDILEASQRIAAFTRLHLEVTQALQEGIGVQFAALEERFYAT